MDFLTAESLPWLGQARQRLRDSMLAGRLPHSSLVLSTAASIPSRISSAIT